MKRPLDVVGGTTAASDAVSTERVRVGKALVWVEGTGNAAEVARFASLLETAGGTRTDEAENPTLRVVIRSSTSGGAAGARTQAELEASADVVLGSVRPKFAERLAHLLLGE